MWATLLAACTDENAAETLFAPEPVVQGSVTIDGPLWQVAVTTAPGDPPAAFSDLPEILAAPDLATFTLDEDAAIGKLRHLLCNVPAARDEVHRLIGDHPKRWKFERVTACGRADYCAWVHRVLDAAPVSAMWWGLSACVDDHTRDRLAASGPDEPFVEYWWRHSLPFHPRLVRVVEESFAVDPQPSKTASTALNTLADTDGPDAEQALLGLYQAAPPSWKDTVAAALWGRTSEAAVAIHGELCGRAAGRTCGWTRYDRLDPATWMRAGLAPERMLERMPGETSTLLERLAECAWSAEQAYERRACARALARVGPVRIPSNADPDLAIAQRPEDLRRQLDELGIAGAEGATLALDALDAAGMTLSLEGGHPDPVALLYEIADRVGLASSAISAPRSLGPLPAGLQIPETFEFAWRDAPSWEEPVDGRVAVRTFLAWSGGTRYRAVLPTTKPATAGAVAFANAVLAARGSSVRAALDVDERRIVLASAATLRGLADRGLVSFAVWDPIAEGAYDESL